MESKDQLKEIDIKNCMCYYFDNTFTDRDIYSVDVLLDEKMYKASTGPKLMLIRFDK